MPVIKPFRGMRYDEAVAGSLSDLVAPPFDIIYDEWRDRLYDRNRYNIVRIIKSREESSVESKYGNAMNFMKEWMSSGVLKIDSEPAIYLQADTYRFNGGEKTRFGFAALVRIEDFGKGIYPHEKTLPKNINDRLRLLESTKTNFSQIFSIYRDQEKEIGKVLDAASEKTPDATFVDDQDITHRLWVLKDPELIGKICAAMKEKEVVIADGHHRYTAALRYKNNMENFRTENEEPFDYVLMYFSDADDPGTSIFPTHRKVRGIENFDMEDFFKSLELKFELEFTGSNDLNYIMEKIAGYSGKTTAFGIYTKNGYTIAIYRNSGTGKELDVKILHDLVLEEILGISPEEVSNGEYVHFSRSPEHAVEDVKGGKDEIAFLLNPVTSDELFRAVLRGELMPQKTTYFFPKTLSGLVMYNMENN